MTEIDGLTKHMCQLSWALDQLHGQPARLEELRIKLGKLWHRYKELVKQNAPTTFVFSELRGLTGENPLLPTVQDSDLVRRKDAVVAIHMGYGPTVNLLRTGSRPARVVARRARCCAPTLLNCYQAINALLPRNRGYYGVRVGEYVYAPRYTDKGLCNWERFLGVPLPGGSKEPTPCGKLDNSM